MSKTEPERDASGDCGPPCWELSERQFAFHLEFLGSALGVGTTAYRRSAKGKKPSLKSCESGASRMLRSAKLQAALQHHRSVEAVRHRATRERIIERLAGMAEGGSLARLLLASGGVDLEVLLSDHDLARAVRAVEFEGDDPRRISKIHLHNPVPAERQLVRILGLDAPIRLDLGPEETLRSLGLLEALEAPSLPVAENVLEQWRAEAKESGQDLGEWLIERVGRAEGEDPEGE